jgi:hypothetical protein
MNEFTKEEIGYLIRGLISLEHNIKKEIKAGENKGRELSYAKSLTDVAALLGKLETMELLSK